MKYFFNINKCLTMFLLHHCGLTMFHQRFVKRPRTTSEGPLEALSSSSAVGGCRTLRQADHGTHLGSEAILTGKSWIKIGGLTINGGFLCFFLMIYGDFRFFLRIYRDSTWLCQDFMGISWGYHKRCNQPHLLKMGYAIYLQNGNSGFRGTKFSDPHV